jgi:hypothetical protein
VPEIAGLNAADGRSGDHPRLTEVDMPKAEVVYEIAVSGLG